ncbi:MAG TPA: hypothetical protein VFS43_36760 [Polyangiaceae bacterium]|nr:hypothetical protein [Polyangiaceae bacterium]
MLEAIWFDPSTEPASPSDEGAVASADSSETERSKGEKEEEEG